MKTPQLRVSVAFAHAPVHKLEERTSAVLAELFDNPNYTGLPVTQTARRELSGFE